MSGFGIGNLTQALARHTRDVAQDNWQVGNNATTTSIPVQSRNPAGKAVDVTGQAANELVGSIIEFNSGANQESSRQIVGVSSTGTLTLDSALGVAPAQGDLFTILKTISLNVSTSENLSQIGATNVPVTSATANVPALPAMSVDLGLYPTGNTGAISATNTATGFTISLGSLAGYVGSLFDVKAISVAINNSGTAETITSMQLVLSDTVGGVAVSTTFNGPPLMSVASGTTYQWRFAMEHGQPHPVPFQNMSLVITFSTAPTAGEVYALAIVQGAGAAPISESRIQTEVINDTINSGEVRFISSGEEVAFYNLTLGGVERVEGVLVTQNLTIEDGATLILADGGTIKTGAFN